MSGTTPKRSVAPPGAIVTPVAELEAAVSALDALDDAPHPPCLDGVVGGPAKFALDLALDRDEAPEVPASIGVDAVGRTEELLVRPLGPLVSGLGPFAGAIVRGDGSLRLAIDAWAVALRARALAGSREAPIIQAFGHAS